LEDNPVFQNFLDFETFNNSTFANRDSIDLGKGLIFRNTR